MTKPALELIARALCHLEGHPENIKFEGRPMWQSFLPNARAALNAIREPTEEMVVAGSGITRKYLDTTDDIAGHRMAERAHDEAAETWRFMINAALTG